MSESELRAFYGYDGSLPEITANLASMTGSAECARELVEAADYVEAICGPEAALMQMSKWVN